MAKKKPITPLSKIKSALRLVFLRSRERAKVLKDHKYTCQCCGTKQSKAKGKEVYVEVHHVGGIDWEGICNTIRERLLATPMITLCSNCHDKEHTKG